MSKKHYEAIAAALHQRLIYAERDRDTIGARINAGEENILIVSEHDEAKARVNEIDDIARDLAATFAKENPRFNGDTFRRACGFEVPA